MVELKAKTPCEGLLPLDVGPLRLSEVEAGPITSVAVFKGQEAALSKAMQAAHGLNMPKPNRVNEAGEARAIWFGPQMALVTGVVADDSLSTHAALTDQSDAWAVVRLDGAGAADVLARLTPVDLRKDGLGPGKTARTEVQHMQASVTCLGVECYQIMVFRAFAETLVHDLKCAMQAVAARRQ
ncbi:MAG TPA: sarcosine oxidase subunit gamma [Roseovarius sp.]|nr:sarcosine oxidase subunit gamma [Roseovarius sp.]